MMTDREKHLSLALDSLTTLEESLREHYVAGRLTQVPYHYWRNCLGDAKASIEAAAMARPSVLRRWFGRTERRERAA